MHWLKTGEQRADPTLAQQYAIIIEHYQAMQDHYGPVTGANMARKHIGWYTKGLNGSAEFRNRVNFIDDPEVVLASLAAFYERLLAAPEPLPERFPDRLNAA
jgi:tRNA-dihydrouridine synthase B